ncbi:MAG: Trypsin [bacterium ADurb.Bin425]|nr:MAG: Trypsin [bacterium ADurb.Bin425]
MTEKQNIAEKPAHSADSHKESTSRILFDDIDSGKTIGRFTHADAKACKTNPEEGTVPTLMPGQRSNGCDFKGMKDLPKDLKHLDFPDIYSKAAESTVRIDSTMTDPHDKKGRYKQEGPAGTGAIIGKDVEKGECLVATANHVINGGKEVNISNVKAVSADGKKYDTEVRYTEPKKDTAVIAMKTGADTEKVCKPFTAVQDVNDEAGKGKNVVALGFPQGSRALYASPGKSDGIRPMREDMSPHNIKELGLEPDATQLKVKNHIKGGQSGGPVVTPEGRLAGLNQSGPDGYTRDSYAVPLDQRRVDELLAKARR